MSTTYSLRPTETAARAVRSVLRTEELAVGDVLTVWWRPGRDTITALRPHDGPLPETQGALIAEFALLPSGMTLLAGEDHEVLR